MTRSLRRMAAIVWSRARRVWRTASRMVSGMRPGRRRGACMSVHPHAIPIIKSWMIVVEAAWAPPLSVHSRSNGSSPHGGRRRRASCSCSSSDMGVIVTSEASTSSAAGGASPTGFRRSRRSSFNAGSPLGERDSSSPSSSFHHRQRGGGGSPAGRHAVEAGGGDWNVSTDHAAGGWVAGASPEQPRRGSRHQDVESPTGARRRRHSVATVPQREESRQAERMLLSDVLAA